MIPRAIKNVVLVSPLFILVAAIGLAMSRCALGPKEFKPPPAKDAAQPLEPSLQALSDALSEPTGVQGKLYRVAGWQGSVWTYTNDVERPDPKIPSRLLGPTALAQLAALTEARYLKTIDLEFISYSYILEILQGGAPLARLDFHTEGFGPSCIMLIARKDERLADGAAQIQLSRDGRKAWLAKLEQLWNEADR